MPDFPFQVERYIVKKLACDVEAETIVEEVNDKFLRRLDPADVHAYCPEANGMALTPDLRDLYQVTRWDFLGETDAEED